MTNPLENCQHILDKISNPKKCKYCDARFGSAKKRIQHVNQVHLMISKEYLCFQCGKSFVSDTNLANHEKSAHSGEDKPKTIYKCEQCDNTYTEQSRFKKHVEEGIQLHILVVILFHFIFLLINIFNLLQTFFFSKFSL